MKDERRTIWTIGHSTRGLEAFIRLLAMNRIEVLSDIRKLPGSKRYPHFNQGPFSESLKSHGVAYLYLPELAGRRKPNPRSVNTAWRNKSFQAYADHMESDEFRRGIERLLAQAERARTAVMCSEAVWWRCHRALVADYLKASGVNVLHIMTEKAATPHPYTSAAKIIDGKLSYRGLEDLFSATRPD